MLSCECNIEPSDRINRIVIGLILFLAALFGMGKIFFMIVGIVLVIQGWIGWCSIPYLLNKIKGK